MNSLPIKTKTVHTVQDNDLEAFIRQVYDVEFSFAADNEVGNDSSVTFAVNGVVDEYDRKRVDQFARGEVITYTSAVILNDMCARGLIPAGDYLIEVCW